MKRLAKSKHRRASRSLTKQIQEEIKTLRISLSTHSIFMKYVGLLQSRTGKEVTADEALRELLRNAK